MWKKYLKNLDLPESFISITLGFLVVIVAGLLIYNSFTKSEQEKGAPPEEVVSEELQLEEKLASLPVEYTVSNNENLWSIAEKYYGSGYNWVTIAAKNKLTNSDYIMVGQVLNIPKAEVIRPESEKMLASAVEPEKTYTIVRGDNLWNIAVREYGDGFAWAKIASANNLTNPDLIHPGNVLTLPR